MNIKDIWGVVLLAIALVRCDPFQGYVRGTDAGSSSAPELGSSDAGRESSSSETEPEMPNQGGTAPLPPIDDPFAAGGSGGGAPVSDPCIALTCEVMSAECGELGDGCGHVLQCGKCEKGTRCEDNRCLCVPKSCGGKDCGAKSDGCGGLLVCGTCSRARVCNLENRCVAALDLDEGD